MKIDNYLFQKVSNKKQAEAMLACKALDIDFIFASGTLYIGASDDLDQIVSASGGRITRDDFSDELIWGKDIDLA